MNHRSRGGGAGTLPHSGNHEIAHDTEQRDEEVAANPMRGNQASACPGVLYSRGSLQDEPDIDGPDNDEHDAQEQAG